MIISPPKPTWTERLLLLLAFVVLLIMILTASFILRHPVAKGVGIIEGDNIQITDAGSNASILTNPTSLQTLTSIPNATPQLEQGHPLIQEARQRNRPSC